MDKEIIESIQNFIETKRNEDELLTLFPNALLRTDTIDLLDHFCTIIYYPLEDRNNGFNIDLPSRKNGVISFVYINTNQTIDKQIFTAAHELGHIWQIDKELIKKGILNSDINPETIMNRFAAELLMPEKHFEKTARSEFMRRTGGQHTIGIGDLIESVAFLMNLYYTPPVSVVLRLAECNIISQTDADKIVKYIGNEDSPISHQLQEVLKDNNFVQFLNPDKKKWIKGLPELFEKASQDPAISPQKIATLRAAFDLPDKEHIHDIQKFEEIGTISIEERQS